MRYYEILFEDFKTAKKKFLASGADSFDIDRVFDEYKKLRNRMEPPKNNIDWWPINSTFNSLKIYLHDLSGIPTSREMKKSKTGKTIILMENDKWLVVIPLDKDASCFHGRNTDWCTTKPFQSYYEQYFYRDKVILIYCIDKQSGNKWAIAAHESVTEREYFDKEDESITYDQFKQQTALDPNKLVSLAMEAENKKSITGTREYYRSLIFRLNELYKENQIAYGKTNLEAEKILLYIKDSNRIQTYFQTVGPSSEVNINLQKVAVNLEPYILQFIENPDKSVIVMALKKDGYVIRFVENQDEDIKKLAISTTPSAIIFVQRPISEELQLLAVTRDGNLIEHIDNPSEAVQLAAVKQSNDKRDNIAISHILKNGIKPRNEVVMASIENEPYLTIYNLIEEKFSLSEEMIQYAFQNENSEPELLLRLLRDEGIPISIESQKFAVNADSYASMRVLLSMNNGKVDESVQISAAAANGYGFIKSYANFYSSLANTISPKAIEEAFKTGHLIDKTIKTTLNLKIKPSFTAFKNAIDYAPEDYNSTIIDILEFAFPFDDIHNKLVKYAEQKAIKENNKMLKILIDEYKSNNDLDNLKFEPEN